MKQFLVVAALTLSAPSASADELSQHTAIHVQQAQHFAQEGKLKKAIASLEALDFSREYEQAYVARMLGVFYWQNGQIQAAITQLELAVNSGRLPDEQAWQTRKMLADILLNEQRFSQALPHYYTLSVKVPKDQKVHELWLRISQSHYQLRQWQAVLSAMARYEKFAQPDQLGALSLKLAAELELKKWQSAISTIKRLIAIEPERIEWWRQLVALYLKVDDHKRALDALALAKLNGLMLSQDDIKLLAHLYAKRGIPEKAALVLNTLPDVNSNSKLKAQQATYWQIAKEWDESIDCWRVAAQLDRQYYWNYAQLLVQEGYYKQAIAALNEVDGRKSDIALIKTRAYYKLKRYDDALANAKKADEIKPSDQAKSWVKYLSQLRQVETNNTQMGN